MAETIPTENPMNSLVVTHQKSPFIFHIPHSSTVIPKELENQFCCTPEALALETKTMGDLFTDELFEPLAQIGSSITAQFSRVACDVERFSDDKEESMSQHGMGAVYTHSFSKNRIRFESHNRQIVLEQFYEPHHAAFNQLVNQCLSTHDKAIIVDCHSFPSKKRWYEPGYEDDKPLPDICIGTDSFHTPKWLADLMVSFFAERGYSVELDYPFSGSVTPLEHYSKSQNVLSIMIEINRKLYMDENTFLKKEQFECILNDLRHLGKELLARFGSR